MPSARYASIAIMPHITARGACVLTWSIIERFAPIDAMMVASATGEQFAPSAPPPITAVRHIARLASVATATGMIIGIIIA